MTTDAQPAESSPAPDPTLVPTTAAEHAVASGDVAAFRAARAAEKAGKPLDVPADSSPAKPAEQAASTEASGAASETAKPPKNAETRVKELLAERARERERAERAERELETLRRGQTPPKPDDKPAESSPAAAPASFPAFDDYLETHPDASYEDYLDARADFRAEQRVKALQETAAKEQARTESQKARQERNTQFRTRIEAAVAADPAFLDSISEEVQHLKPFEAIRDEQGRWIEQPTGYHAVAEELLGSEVAPQLMRHFSDHPEDLHRIAKLPPNLLLKEMGKLEVSLTAAKPVPPLKTVTDAPPPPTQVGSKQTAPSDPVEAAVHAGDMAAFKAARLRQRAGLR